MADATNFSDTDRLRAIRAMSEEKFDGFRAEIRERTLGDPAEVLPWLRALREELGVELSDPVRDALRIVRGMSQASFEALCARLDRREHTRR